MFQDTLRLEKKCGFLRGICSVRTCRIILNRWEKERYRPILKPMEYNIRIPATDQSDAFGNPS
ncbi:MAG: hypothetical protein Q4C96_03985 [Planctomycetia bacterium]|nr:hypothetical protein [Planctomycetia bacterium]